MNIKQDEKFVYLKLRDLILKLDKKSLQFTLEKEGKILSQGSGITVSRYSRDNLENARNGDYSSVPKKFEVGQNRMTVSIDDARNTYFMKWTLETDGDCIRCTLSLLDKKDRNSFVRERISVNPCEDKWLFTTWDMIQDNPPISKLKRYNSSPTGYSASPTKGPGKNSPAPQIERADKVSGPVKPGFVSCWKDNNECGWGISRDFNDEESLLWAELSPSSLSCRYDLFCPANAEVVITTLIFSAHDYMDMFNQVVGKYPHIFKKEQKKKYPKLWGGMQKGDPGIKFSNKEKELAKEFYWVYVEDEVFESAPFYMPDKDAWSPANRRTVKLMTTKKHRDFFESLKKIIPHSTIHFNSRRMSSSNEDKFPDALALQKDGTPLRWPVRDTTVSVSYHPAYSVYKVAKENIEAFYKNYSWADTVYIDNFWFWTSRDYAHIDNKMFKHIYYDGDESPPYKPLTYAFQHQTVFLKEMAKFAKRENKLLIINANPLATEVKYADMATTDVNLSPGHFGTWFINRFNTVSVPLNAKTYDSSEYEKQLKLCTAFGIIRSFGDYMLHKDRKIINDIKITKLHRRYSAYMHYLGNLELDPSIGPHVQGTGVEYIYAFAFKTSDEQNYIISIYNRKTTDEEYNVLIGTAAKKCGIVFNPNSSTVNAEPAEKQTLLKGKLKGTSCLLVLLRKSNLPVVVGSSTACLSENYNSGKKILTLLLQGGKGAGYQVIVNFNNPPSKVYKGSNLLDNLTKKEMLSGRREGFYWAEDTGLTYVGFNIPLNTGEVEIRLQY